MRKRDQSKFRHVKANKRARLFRAAPRSNSVDMIQFKSSKKRRRPTRENSAGSGFKMNISQSNYSLHYDEDLTSEYKVGATKRSKNRTKKNQHSKLRTNSTKVPKILKLKKRKISKAHMKEYQSNLSSH
jgi:UDP-N-acetylenolpyruvoylglucosamine reductase